MNDPREHATAVVSKEAIATNLNDVEQLLQSNQAYQSLIFAFDGSDNIGKIAQIVLKQRTNLHSLVLDRGSSSIEPPIIPIKQANELGQAVLVRSLELYK